MSERLSLRKVRDAGPSWASYGTKDRILSRKNKHIRRVVYSVSILMSCLLENGCNRRADIHFCFRIHTMSLFLGLKKIRKRCTAKTLKNIIREHQWLINVGFEVDCMNNV